MSKKMNKLNNATINSFATDYLAVDREEILSGVTMRLNRDDGHHFTDVSRLGYIKEMLKDSDYEIMAELPLAVLYKKKGVAIPKEVTVISSHIDCKQKEGGEDGIYNPSFAITAKGNYKGTFDNSATNAALIIAMREQRLDERIVVAFTGDEERTQHGAKQVIQYFKAKDTKIFPISLDVTFDDAYKDASFTIENLCANTDMVFANMLFDSLHQLSLYHDVTYRFMRPAYNDYFGDDNSIFKQYFAPEFDLEDCAAPDESSDTYGLDNACCLGAFSLCLPTKNGDMHSDKPITIKKKSFEDYIDALVHISNDIQNARYYASC